jgi:acetyl-CoA synthetase
VGELFIVPPSIGLSTTLLNQEHHQVYFAGTPKSPDGQPLRRHGDQMRKIGKDRWCGLGRADDTMNLAGIKVSSAEIETVLRSAPGVLEVAAVAASPVSGPSLLVIYAVVPGHHAGNRADVLQTMQQMIRQEMNPLFKIHDLVFIESLPKTRSNKVMRKFLRDQWAMRNPGPAIENGRRSVSANGHAQPM